MEHDKKHVLNANDETTLKDIEQLQDRSNLTSLYPKPRRQWSGKLLSFDERQEKRDTHFEEIRRSIRKHFFSIGLLIPLPFLLVVAAFVLSQRFISFEDRFASLYIVPSIIIGAVIIAFTFFSLKALRSIFYDHAMAIGPFYLALITLLCPAGIISYETTMWAHNNDPVTTITIVGIVVILFSVLFSLALLLLWTTKKLSGRSKMMVLLCTIGLLIVIAAACSAVRLVKG